jgi:secondary thiamine-phosphate synthase enzyme
MEDRSMLDTIHLTTTHREQLVDITDQVKATVDSSGVSDGLVNVYAQGATAAIVIHENSGECLCEDMMALLAGLIPHGVWRNDISACQGDAHLKSALVGPSECIPVVNGKLGLSPLQNVFFCEFSGPREDRSVMVTVLADA